MRSFALLAATLMAMTVVAQPAKHVAHQALHAMRDQVLEKRDTVLYTERVVVTECVNVTVTSTITDNSAPTTIVPSINTAPYTEIIGSSTIKDALGAVAYVEKPVPSSTTTVTIPSPSLSSVPPTLSSVEDAPTTSNVVPAYSALGIPDSVDPSSSVVPAVSPPPSSVVPAVPAVAPSSVAPSVPAVALPQSSSPPPTSSGDLNPYGLAMPPTDIDRTSECTSSSCEGLLKWNPTYTDTMACSYPNMQNQGASKLLVALGHGLMGLSSSKGHDPANGNCGRMISIKCPSSGKETRVNVVDKCPGCELHTLDVSEAAYIALGFVPGNEPAPPPTITWQFLN